MRYAAWLFFLLVIGCASKPGDQTPKADDQAAFQRARTALKAQAEEAGQAAVHEDHARMAELTVPALVEKFGGRAGYVKKLESMAAETRDRGFRIKKVTIGEPSPLAAEAGVIYAIVPEELEMSGPGGVEGRQHSYLIAVSWDAGVSWKFLDEKGIGGDRRKLSALLPNCPQQLPLPAVPPPVWDEKPAG